MEKSKKRGKAKRIPQPAERPAPRASKAPLAVQAQAPVGALGGLKRGTRAQAFAIVFEDALADGEGFTFGCVGAPRYGKTHLLKEVLDQARTKGIVERAFIHDTKKPGVPQYDGAICSGVEQFVADGGRFDAELVVVFNGPDFLVQPSVQDVCDVALASKQEGFAVAVVADEVYKATNGFGQFLEPAEGPALFPLFLREGTSQRISTLWTTQIPQELPTACKVLTRCVAQFHLESLAADAATEKFRLDKDGPAVLRSLQRGEFVLFCQGREWDRTIYGPG